MATYTFDKIDYGGNTYVVQDSGALQLTGGNVTGPVTFGDSITVDEATLGDLVVNGNASFTNNIQANTINGVAVGSSPKFTDTVTTVTTSGSGNAITAISASNGAITATKGTTFLTSHNTYTISTTGSGNAVTAVSLSGTTFTVTKGTTFLTSLPSHNHSQIITVGDQRSTATTPNSYSNALIFQGLKNKATIGSPSNDTYSYLIGLRGWSDSSGGNSHEIAFNDTGVFVRRGATTTWGNWERLYTTGNKPTASDVGLGNVENKSSATIRGELTSSNVTTALGYTPYNSTNPSGYTANTGTVTKVTAGTGLSIGTTAGGNFTTSGTINHTNSVTAQTTQAVYPIKIDAQGHISAYGSAVTIPDVSAYNKNKYSAGTGLAFAATDLPSGGLDITINHSNSVTAQTTQAVYPIKIDAQGHISAYGSAVTIPTITLNGSATTSPSFYAPTGTGTSGQFLKSSGSGQPTWSTVTIPTITQNGSATTTPSFYAPVTAGTSGHVLKSNGSGAPTWTSATLTDTMVTTAALTSGTTYYPILATGTGTATRQIDSTLGGLKYTSAAGTTSAIGSATLQLGNATASGTTNNEQGILKLYGTNSYVTSLRSGTPTASRTIDLPDWSGTVALTNYTVGDYTYLNFTPSVAEVDGSYAFAEYRLSASSWDGTNYRVLNYILGSNDFQIYSQTLEKNLIHVRNFTDSSYDNYVSIRKLCTPTQDDDAATKKYVDDAALKTVVVTPTVTASTGTKVSAEMRKYGNVVQFTLTFKNTSSVASGSEVFVGTLSTNKPLQLIDSACYFGSHALVMSINTSGGITIRNASNSAVTCNSNTMVGATWLV